MYRFLNHGNYPYTNLDNINLDWFIEDAFRMKDFVKREVEDIQRMKEWVIKNMVKVDVIAELVKAVAIKAEDKAKIKANLDIKEGGKIDGIKVNGQAVPVVNKTAEITLPDPPEPQIIPITDVKVNGATVVQNKVANISIPEPPTIPITDVKVNGATVVQNKVANINTVSTFDMCGIQKIPMMDGLIKYSALDMGAIISVSNFSESQKVTFKQNIGIPNSVDEYRTACGIENVEGKEF